MPRNSGALVVGFRREDERRFARVAQPEAMIGNTRIPLLGQRPRVYRLPTELQCNLNGGACISCGRDVYLNRSGYSALIEKDADVCCTECEDRYSAEMTKSL